MHNAGYVNNKMVIFLQVARILSGITQVLTAYFYYIITEKHPN